MTKADQSSSEKNGFPNREYPFSSSYLELNNGLKMHYIDRGQGTPAVMLHGNPTWSFLFRRLVLKLEENNHRAIVPDHIGCGFSDKPQKWPYRLSDHIANLTEFIDKINLPMFDLIVHDWGGAIGFGFAVNNPERIRRIIVLNSAAFLVTRCPWRINLCRWPLIGPFIIRRCNGFVRAALKMAPAKPENLTPEIKEGYIAPYKSYKDRVAILGFVRDIPISADHPTRKTMQNIQDKLNLLRNKPMLICWGMKDFCFTPAFLDIWTSYFPEAQVKRFPEAGHYILEDEPTEINQLVSDFTG